MFAFLRFVGNEQRTYDHRAHSVFTALTVSVLAMLSHVEVVYSADDSVATEPVFVSAGGVIEQGIGAEGVYDYLLRLEPGANLLVIDQLGMDVNVTVIADESRTFNIPTLRDERETILFQSATASNVSVQVSTDEYTEATGRYRLTIEPILVAGEIEAYRLMTEASAALHGESAPGADTARSLYEDAFALWEGLGNVSEQARTKYILAYLEYWHAFQWTDAANAAAEAAFLYAQSGRADLQANAIFLHGVSLAEVALEGNAETDAPESESADDMFKHAMELLNQAANMQLSNDQRYDYAQTQNNIGYIYQQQARWSDATPYYLEAAEIFREMGELAAELNPLANLAVIDQDSGNFMRAAAAQERLLQFIPVDEEPEWRADTLDNYAKASLVLGNADTAMASFLEALELHKKTEGEKGLKGQGLSLSGLGLTYRMVGDLEIARWFLDLALPIRKQTNDGAGQMSVLRALADIDLAIDNYESALTNLGDASRLAVSPLVRSGLDVMKAQAWIGLEEYERADVALENARTVAADIGAARDLADAYFWSGRLAGQLGDSDGAIGWLELARGLYRDIRVLSGEGESLFELAQLSLEANDYSAAISFGSEALGKVEGLRNEVTSPELKAVFLGARSQYYEVLIEATMRASAAAQSAAEQERLLYSALEVSERAKARSTVNLINEASIDISGNVDASTAARLDSLNGLLAETLYRINQLAESAENQEALQENIAELSRIRAELDVLESAVRNNNPQFASVRNPEILRAPEIQGALGPDDVLLQYWFGDSASYLWIVTQRNIRSAKLPVRDRINEISTRLYSGLANPSKDRETTKARDDDLAEIANTVIAPAIPEIQSAARVIIAADGALHYLPLGALVALDGKALIETHEVIAIPSMTVVTTQRRLNAGRTTPTQTIAIVGDPVFNTSDSRFSDSMVFPPDKGSVFPPKSFDRLPFSGQEIQRISELVPEEKRLVATGFDATIVRVGGEALRDYRYVHFATHGVIDSAQPAVSSLIFSMRDAGGHQQSGNFSLRDVYNMKLSADVVVLSACETALGREIRGEGLIGLTQGFLYAGAQSVVASLWQVPDRATAELMTRFYSNLLELKQGPADALRNAQVDLARDRRWRDPYFWGGFVLLGEWQ